MPKLPTGTLTFLFTDIEGSTRLWEEAPEAMAIAITRHDTLLTKEISDHGGKIVKNRGEGDSHFVVFSSAVDAVAGACALQRTLQMECWPTPAPLRLRIALHSGEAVLRPDDYYGTAVNRCARLRAIAHGGQTLLSGATHELVRDALPEGVALVDLGFHRLKDLQRPERVYQLVHADLPTDFPSLNSLDSFPNNLPRQLTSFIGRESEIRTVKDLLTTHCLLTLTGPGGCGKTRLALQSAAEVLEQYPDGIWLVELGALADSGLVAQSIASALRVAEQPGRPLLESLVDYLQSRALLLLLDNCEHLLPAAAGIVEMLLQRSQSVRVLATSREPLGIGGERCHPVPPMSLPDRRDSSRGHGSLPGIPVRGLPSQRPGRSRATSDRPTATILQCEAVRLFAERAGFRQPSFALTERNAPTVARVCERLDGIPLAIELAAARVRVLTVEQIANRMDDFFRLLTGGSPTALPRQQTLQAAIDWSYDLLSERERILFRRLGVFNHGFTLEAAEAVCGDDSVGMIGSEEILDLLARLADKSLILVVSVEEGDAGEVVGSPVHGDVTAVHRYRMLETIRQYSLRRLAEAGEAEALRSRHRDWFLGLAERAEPELRGMAQAAWLKRLETEHDNLRAALEQSLSASGGIEEALRLGTALWRFWYVRGYSAEGLGWLERMLSRSEGTPSVQRAKACNNAGILAGARGDYAGARSFHEESLHIRRALNDRLGIAHSLTNLGLIERDEGNYACSQECFGQSLVLFEQLEDPRGTGTAVLNLGCNCITLGDYPTALRYLEESLTIHRTLGDRWLVAVTLNNLGRIAHAQGEDPEAARFLSESLALRQEIGDRRGIPVALRGLGAVARAQGDPMRATLLYAAAEAARESMQGALPAADTEHLKQNVDVLRAQLGEASFHSAWTQGSTMTLEQAVEYALQPSDARPQAESADGGRSASSAKGLP